MTAPHAPLTVRYRSLISGQPARPILALHVTGINGRSGGVFGLIDSGADNTSLPIGYATLMGYEADHLEVLPITQVAGTVNAYRAKIACTAVIPELPDVAIPLLPWFVPGAQTPLWGRMDFMRVFDIEVHEVRQEFVLTVVQPGTISPS